jgi:hypothetical protein
VTTGFAISVLFSAAAAADATAVRAHVLRERRFARSLKTTFATPAKENIAKVLERKDGCGMQVHLPEYLSHSVLLK